ncbi:hypothetical protein O6H91_13G094600 [Diphasiastrum complanatum]|uniref:Uncharacterized protein n=1 Tax=Diphasiastrum complanatum TaxID=34168 RepID=A0ACC2BYE3_DIPCM|nr:hypothetical protein O6H91_13G094600 [Diphasiastrum complanatum]
MKKFMRSCAVHNLQDIVHDELQEMDQHQLQHQHPPSPFSSTLWDVDKKRTADDERHRLKPVLSFFDPMLLGRFVGCKAASGARGFAWLQSQIVGHDLKIRTPFGRRLLTYADHTASGRSLLFIERFILENVLPAYGNTHTDDSYVGQLTSSTVHEAAMYIKACMGGTNDDALFFCGSGCTAALKRLQEVMGISVPSMLREKILQLLQPRERWLVFVGPYEHHSNLLSWQNSLAEVIEIPADGEGLIDLAKLKEHLEDPKHKMRRKLGSFSACSNVTGILTDTRKISRLFHKYKAFVCFDFASCGSHEQIDIRSGQLDGYDAVVLSPHKFVGGPGSPGILLMNKHLYLLQGNPPSTCGGGTVDYVNNISYKDTLFVDDVEMRENAGTPPILQTIRAALAFWIKQYMGVDLIVQRECFLAQKALSRLLSNRKVLVLGNTQVKRTPIVSFVILTEELWVSPHAYAESMKPACIMSTQDNPQNKLEHSQRYKRLHGRFVTKLLSDLFGIQARGGCSCAGAYAHSLLSIDKPYSLKIRTAVQQGYHGVKPGWTRVSFAYYTSNDEFEYIMSSIEFIAEHGQHFLPLYDFDWKTGNWTNKQKIVESKRMVSLEIEDKALSNIKKVVKLINLHKKEKMNKDGNFANQAQRRKAYIKYMQAAERIAKCLPPQSHQSAINYPIDPHIVNFRI